MNKKERLLKLFSDTTEYYYHIIKNDIGHIIYVTKEKDEYSTDNLEFTKNSIIEGFLNNIENITFEKVAHSIYFTNEENTERLKYKLNNNMKENDNFSNFIKNIIDDYRKTEVDDFIEQKTDPEGYKKRKEEEYKEKQKQIWERYQKQVEEEEKIRREAIKKYDGNLIKLLKDNLLGDIIKKEEKFDVYDSFMKIILSILSNEDNNIWPKRNTTPIVGNEHFKPISIKDNKLKILLKDKMSESYVLEFELKGPELNVLKCNKNNAKYIKDYKFLMKIYNIKNNFDEWEFMSHTEKLNTIIKKIIKDNKIEKTQE